MRISKLCYLGFCSIALTIGLLSCTEEPAIVAVSSVTLDSTSITLIEGDSQTLTATVSPSNAENQKVLWSSSNSSVASVKEGVVTALKAGNAKITAKTDDGGKTATCTVIVETKNIPVTGVTLDKTSYEMTEGDEITLTATVNPENATNKNVSWSSSNSSVATVKDGRVTALNAGTATITAKTDDGDKTALCEITVDKLLYQDLASNGTANCYIITKSGSYEFLPTKGNTSEPISNIASVVVLWETFGTAQAPSIGDLISNVTYKNGLVKIKTNSYFNKGNAVIAAKDANNIILWSWHIWFTDEPQTQTYYNNSGVMMDRNLGATSSSAGTVESIGLFYQWGRKDPFLGYSSTTEKEIASSTKTWPEEIKSDSSTGTIDFTIANPTTFLTGNDNNDDWYYMDLTSVDNTRWQEEIKTIYDPCPTGWRIPIGGKKGVWSTASKTEYVYKLEKPFDKANKGMNLQGIMGDDNIWYPAAAYRPLESSLNFVGYYCYYWSSTNDRSRPYGLHITDGSYLFPGTYDGLVGSMACSVRCVKED